MAEHEESEELLNAVKDSLTRDGHMNKFKAELRAAVISVLNKSTGKQSHSPPDPPAEVRIINDLIKEYFEWMGFRYSEQVLTAECGQSEKMSRKELESKLHIEEKDSMMTKMPLLYHILLAHIHKKD